MTTDQPFQSVSPGSEWQKEAEENGRRSAAPAPRMCLIIDEAEEVDKTCDKAHECGPCLGVGRIASSWEGREVNIDCPNCGGTGRAR